MKFSILENLNLESLFTSLLKSLIAKLFKSLLDLFVKFFFISIFKFGLNSFFLIVFVSKIFETFFANFSIFFSSVQIPDFVSKEQFDKKQSNLITISSYSLNFSLDFDKLKKDLNNLSKI